MKGNSLSNASRPPEETADAAAAHRQRLREQMRAFYGGGAAGIPPSQPRNTSVGSTISPSRDAFGSKERASDNAGERGVEGASAVPLSSSQWPARVLRTSSIVKVPSLGSSYVPSAVELQHPIDSEYFSVQQYTTQLLQQETLQGLVETDTRLLREVRRLDQELQELVYRNYSKFIAATDTIREMHSHVSQMKTRLSALHDHVNTVEHTSQQVFAALQPHRKRVKETITVNRKLKKACFIKHLPQTMEGLLNDEKYSECVQCWVMGDSFFQKHLPPLTVPEGQKEWSHTHAGVPSVATTSRSARDRTETTKEALQTTEPSQGSSVEPLPSASLLRTTLSALRRSCWKVVKRLYLQMEDAIAATPLDDPTAIDTIHELVEHLRLLRATSLFVPSFPASSSSSSSFSHPLHPSPPLTLRMVVTEQGEAGGEKSASPSIGKKASNVEDGDVSFEESIRQVLMRSVYANFSRDMSTTQLSLQDAFRLPRPPRAIAASLKKEPTPLVQTPSPSPSSILRKGDEKLSPSGHAVETGTTPVSPLFVPSVQEALRELPLPQRHLPLEKLALHEPLAHLKSACALLAGNSARIQEVLLLQGGGAEEENRVAQRSANTEEAPQALEKEKVSICVAQHVQPALMDMLEDFRCCFTAWVYTYFQCLFQHLPASPSMVELPLASPSATPSTTDIRVDPPKGENAVSLPVTASVTPTPRTHANPSSSSSSSSPLCGGPLSPELEENTMTLIYLLYYPDALKEMLSNFSIALLRHLRLMSVTLKELGNAYLNTPLRQYQSKGYASLVDQCVIDILTSCATLLQERFQGFQPPLLYAPSSMLPFRRVRMDRAAHEAKDAMDDICSDCAEMPLLYYSTSALTTFLTILRASDLPPLPSSASSSSAAVLASTPSHSPSSETLLGSTVATGSADHTNGDAPASSAGSSSPPSWSTGTGSGSSPSGNVTTTTHSVAVFPSLAMLVPHGPKRMALVAAATAASFFHFVLTHFACASLVSVVRAQLEQMASSSSSSLSTTSAWSTSGGASSSPFTLPPSSALQDASPSGSLASSTSLVMDPEMWSDVLYKMELAVAAVTQRAILLEGQSSAARLAAALFHRVEAMPNPEVTEVARPSVSSSSASPMPAVASRVLTDPSSDAFSSEVPLAWEEDYLRQWYFHTLLPLVSLPTSLAEHDDRSLSGGKGSVGRHGQAESHRPGSNAAAPCPQWVHPQFWNVVMVEWTLLFRFLTHSFKLTFSSLAPPTRNLPPSFSSGFPRVDGGMHRNGNTTDPYVTALPPPPALHSPRSHGHGGRRHSTAGMSLSLSSSSLPSSISVVQPRHRSRRQKIAVAYLRQEQTSLQNHIDAIFLQQTPLFDTTPANGEPSSILRSVILYVLRSLVDRIRMIPPLQSSPPVSSSIFSCTDFTFVHIHLHATFLLTMLLEPPMISKQNSERTPSFRVHPYSGGGSSSVSGTSTSTNSGTSGGDSLFPFSLPLSTREWTCASGGWGEATSKLFQREVDELCICAFERRRRNKDDETESVSTPSVLEQWIHASLEAYVSEIYRVAITG